MEQYWSQIEGPAQRPIMDAMKEATDALSTLGCRVVKVIYCPYGRPGLAVLAGHDTSTNGHSLTWTSHYAAMGYIRHDAVLQLVRDAVPAFSYDDVTNLAPSDKIFPKMRREAKDVFGLVDGYAVSMPASNSGVVAALFEGEEGMNKAAGHDRIELFGLKLLQVTRKHIPFGPITLKTIDMSRKAYLYLPMLADGMSEEQMAFEQGVSVHTVRMHTASIRSHFDVQLKRAGSEDRIQNREQLIRLLTCMGYGNRYTEIFK